MQQSLDLTLTQRIAQVSFPECPRSELSHRRDAALVGRAGWGKAVAVAARCMESAVLPSPAALVDVVHRGEELGEVR